MSAAPDAATEAYKRALVDEALTRTPRGGFPEIERREGLRPGTLFDWVDAYGPPKLPTALHFWIGTTAQTEAQFISNFEVPDSYWQDEEASAVDAGIGFSVDLDEEHVYDEDLLLVIHHDVPRSVSELVAESTLESEVSAAAIERSALNSASTTRTPCSSTAIRPRWSPIRPSCTTDSPTSACSRADPAITSEFERASDARPIASLLWSGQGRRRSPAVGSTPSIVRRANGDRRSCESECSLGATRPMFVRG